MQKAMVVVILMASLIVGGFVTAEALTFDYTGVVTIASDSDATLAAVYPVGTPAALSFTFDALALPSPCCSTPTFSQYIDVISAAQVTLGAQTWSLDTVGAGPGGVMNDIYIDPSNYTLGFPLSGPTVGGHYTASTLGFALGFSEPVFSSPFPLPLTAPNPFDPLVISRQLLVDFVDLNNPTGNLDGVEVNWTPKPGGSDGGA